ncbi:MAG: hypothetical protein E6H63_17375 [Betaproteobacteria bacterium]|nr:MAG: hypothetical protein E6H63_17375 [Betaproteobacteria bacterium]
MIGQAAVAIWCDVAFEVREEFNHWHAHEHMPERLGIPGFLRGSRWVAEQGAGYFILYEARDEEAITGRAYLERLNNPTPWSCRMMPHHRNMVRGPCRVEASYGAGLASALLTVRFSAQREKADALRAWLTEILAAMPARKGLVASALLHDIGAPQAAPTAEQRLRGGGDRAPDWVVLVNGYSAETVAAVAARDLNDAELSAHGALPGGAAGLYRLAYVLADSGYTERPEEAA